MSDAIDAALTPAKLKSIVAAWLSAASNGEPWAVKELLDRCSGKAAQSIELHGDLSFTVSEFYRALADRCLQRS